MSALDELLNSMSDEDYLEDDVQFLIDKDLRTITIPQKGVVLGVVGDRNVNRVNFQMPKLYNGFDMSEFSVRINYQNANGDVNYYDVTDVTVLDDDTLAFTWLVEADACAYIGQVTFLVYMFKANGDELIQKFHSTVGRASVLVGLEVDEYIDPEPVTDILTKLKLDLEKAKDEAIQEIQEAGGGGGGSSAAVQQLVQDVESLKSSVVKTVNGLEPVNGNVNISSSDLNPDDIQEAVDNYLAAHPVSNVDSVARTRISELNTALQSKVNVVSGKGLSSNDYTNVDKQKVNAIPDNPQYTDTVYDDTDIRNIIAAKANKYKMKNVTLTASKWSGTTGSAFVYIINVDGVTTSTDVQILPRNTIAYEQGLAWASAMILTATANNGTIILRAFGEKPTIDIPITVLIGSDVEVL